MTELRAGALLDVDVQCDPFFLRVIGDDSVLNLDPLRPQRSRNETFGWLSRFPSRTIGERNQRLAATDRPWLAACFSGVLEDVAEISGSAVRKEAHMVAKAAKGTGKTKQLKLK